MIRQDFISNLSKNYQLRHYHYNQDTSLSFPHAVKLDIDFMGNSYESWGVAQDINLAYFKALMELIERISLDRYSSLIFKKDFIFSKEISVIEIAKKFKIAPHLIFPQNSNGVAISTSASKAKISALKELIERHVLLCSLILNIPPQRYVKKLFETPIDGHEIQFYVWKFNRYFVAIAADTLKNGGFIYTHACSTNPDQAVIKAFEELVPNIIFYDNHPSQHSDYSIVKNDLKSFRRYWKHSGDKRLKEFLDGSTRMTKSNQIPPLSDIFFAPTPIPALFTNEFPNLHCYRAISPQAQQLFFDNWGNEYINPLYRGFGKLPSYPHMIS